MRDDTEIGAVEEDDLRWKCVVDHQVPYHVTSVVIVKQMIMC